MGTLFQKALFQKVFFYWTFCGCLFTENWNKTGKMTAKMYFFNCDSLYIMCINFFSHGLEQGCQTQFLEGHSPAEFSSNPN